MFLWLLWGLLWFEAELFLGHFLSLLWWFLLFVIIIGVVIIGWSHLNIFWWVFKILEWWWFVNFIWIFCNLMFRGFSQMISQVLFMLILISLLLLKLLLLLLLLMLFLCISILTKQWWKPIQSFKIYYWFLFVIIGYFLYVIIIPVTLTIIQYLIHEPFCINLNPIWWKRLPWWCLACFL